MSGRIGIFALCCALGVIAFAGAAQGATRKLVGTVGPGYTITLKDGGGKRVTKLSAGSYTILVHDRSDIHLFHLTGPGVDRATSLIAKGDRTWTLRLKAGRYHYQCDPHQLAMEGDFVVA